MSLIQHPSRLIAPFLFLIVLAAPLRSAEDDGPATSKAPQISLKDVLPRTYFRDPNKSAPPAEIKEAIEKFFTGLKAGETQKAYDDLMTASALAARREQVKAMVGATEQATGLYGKILSYELFDNYNIGSSLLILTYMSNLQKQPLRWRFVFYKAEKKWEIMNLRYDDVIDVLIE